MADNVQITAGSGTTIATDDAGAGGHVQVVKLAVSTDGSATALTANNTDGLLVNLGTNNDVTDGGGSLTVDAPVGTPVFVRLSDGSSAIATLPVSATAYEARTRISVTPTVSTTPAYTAKDAVGGLLTFSNAARTSGGSIVIDSVVIIDNSQQQPALELVLFDRTFTASTDNAIFAPSDADLANTIGTIAVSNWSDYSTNSSATRSGLGLAAKLNGTDLFGQLLTRGTPTFAATNDIVVILTIKQD